MPKLSISQNERILLHLAEFDRYRDEPDVPMGVSQEGIAQRLGIQVFNASRALSSLEAEGLVFDRLAHVRGAPKRRRAYFLTEKGRAAAGSIRADIGKRRIVLEHSGTVQELSVDEAVKKLTSQLGRSVSFSEVVEVARAVDVVSSSAFSEEEPETSAPSTFILKAYGKPKVMRFFGREAELNSLREALEGGSVSNVLIWGLPGIGKSTLASKLADSLAGRYSIFWYSFHEWDTEQSFAGVLSDFLVATGRSSLQTAIRRGAGAADVLSALVSDLSDNRAIFFLDDIQKPRPEPFVMLSLLMEAAKRSGTSKVVFISRSVPSLFSPASVGNLSIEVKELDRDSAWKLASSINVKEAGRIVQAGGGHPLLITIMAGGILGHTRGDISSFIEKEVFSTLGVAEKRALALLSVFRHPVQFDAFEGVEYEVISALRSRALVVEQEDGIATHDIIREFFLSHTSAAELRALHQHAARYCARKEGVEWVLERLYHESEAGDWAGAAKVALDNASDLAREFPNETLAVLSKLDLSAVPDGARAELLFLRGQLRDDLGMHDQALADLESILSLLKPDADAERRALVVETIAKLHAHLQHLSEAMAGHEHALRLYQGSEDIDGQIRELLHMGGIHKQRGDMQGALSIYAKALELATRAERRALQAACLNNIALVELDQGRLADAERKMKESVRLAHAVRDFGGEARGLENLARLEGLLGRTSDSATLYQESSEAFRKAGELEECKRMLAKSALLLCSLGRHAEAVEMCEKALTRPELRKRRGLFEKGQSFDAGDLELSSTIVSIARASGDLKLARKELARYTAMAEAMGDPVLIADSKLTQSVVEEETGRLDEAAQRSREALEILRTTGGTEGLIAANMRLGTVLEKKGAYSEAAEHYEQAAVLAERIGDRLALSVARDCLRSVQEDG